MCQSQLDDRSVNTSESFVSEQELRSVLDEANKEVLNLQQHNLEHGEFVLADRCFDIADDLALHGVSLVIPPFTKGRNSYPRGK